MSYLSLKAGIARPFLFKPTETKGTRTCFLFGHLTAMVKDYCAITDSHNTTGTIERFNKSVKLHHLPKKQSLRSAWIRGITRLNYKGGYYT